MEYLKINGVDYSPHVNELKIEDVANYTAQTNAAGNTVVDYINNKRTITVGLIPLNAETMQSLQAAIGAFSVTLSFLNPRTNELEIDIPCIIPSNGVDYYTIQTDKVMYKAFTLKFIEL